MFQNQKNNKERLYKYLIELIKNQQIDYSQTEIKSNIVKYGVYLNTKLVFSQLEWIYTEIDEVVFDHWPKRVASDFSKIQTVYEDAETLIINKPKGVVVESGTGNLYNNLINHYENKYYSVHRLDKETSGLLILAKSEDAQKFYQDQFRNRTVQKKYLTVVSGQMDKVTQITSYQVKDKTNPLRQKFFWYEVDAKNYDSNYRRAQSIFYPLFYCVELDLTIIEVQIQTGRMHQIRLQLESLAYPVLLDPVYNQEAVDQLHSSTKPKVIKIAMQKKHGFEYKKQVIKNAIDNRDIKPELIEIMPIKAIPELNAEEFNKLRIEVFGDLNYSLISNYLGFKLMNQKGFNAMLFDTEELSKPKKINPLFSRLKLGDEQF